MSRVSDLHFSRPPMLPLYSKHDGNPWHNVRQDLVLCNIRRIQPRTNKGRTQIRPPKPSLHLTRRVLQHQMTMTKQTTHRQSLILTQNPMTKGLSICPQKRIHPMGGIRGRRFSAYWSSKIFSSLPHPISLVRRAFIPYRAFT